MDFTKQSPVILSLCPGMRGLERGFERACRQLNWKHGTTAAYVEIEAFIVWNLVKQMEQGVLDPAPIHTNIKTFDGKPFCGKVHGIFGGYPCQPFSLAGERRGTDDPRHLWPFISGIIDAVRPVFCFFENVSGHLSLGYGEVYRSLRDLGYRVETGIFTAEETGAPHQRERLFILAIKNELANSHSFGCTYSELKKLTTEGRINALGDIATACGNVMVDTNDTRGGASECGVNAYGAEGNEGEKIEPFIGVGGPSEIEVVHASNNNIQRVITEYANTEKWKEQRKRSFIPSNLWPARPVQQQYGWEEPRIKSKLGFTVNGYNFREDLLRMAGNGVVEQTAEIAFINLLKKHLDK